MRPITASAYVLDGDRFLFAVGLTGSGESLGVVRLGGHLEPNESSWECAVREIWEEAGIGIAPLMPPATYWSEANTGLVRGAPPPGESEPAPPLLIFRRGDGQRSVTYLVRADGRPAPCSETQGLLFLTRAEVVQLTTERCTLRQFLERGGTALFRMPLPLDLELKPYPHLKLLPELLRLHPELMP